MPGVKRRLYEAWAEFGHLYCEACEEQVDLSAADTYNEARDIAIEHHQEEHK